MVAHLVRLKLALLRNGLRRSAWHVVGLVIGVVYGLGVVALVVAGMAAVSTQDLELQKVVTVLVGAALVLGWWVVPLVAFGVDATLDPERFATFAIPRPTLVLGLALAALVGVAGVLSAVAAVSTSLAWWRHPEAMPVALVGGVLGLAVAVVGGRALAAAAAPLVARRRVREVLTVLVLLAFVAVGPALSGLTGSLTLSADTFRRVADVVAWTPFGAPFAASADAAVGDWGTAALRLAIGAATLGLAVLVWDRALTRALVEPLREAPSTRRAGLGPFARVPATQLGAVVARCLVYWVRDPRYAMALAIVPFTPVLLWVVGRGGGLLLLSGPAAAVLCGWGLASDVSYDGTAFWTHLSAGVRGWVDRLGRIIASAFVAVPLVALLTVGTTVWTGHAADLPAMLGVSFGMLLTAYAGASIVSALVVQPVQQPGDNPFQQRQGTSVAAVVSQTVGWAVVMVASLPEAVLAGFAVAQSSAALGWAALVVGLGLGAGLLVVGVRVGGRLVDQRGPALLQRLVAFQ